MFLYNKRIFERCFNHPKKYWYDNIRYIPMYFRLIHHLIKYGYDEYATWETADWFITTMRPILVRLRDNHHGVPVSLSDNPEKWRYVLNQMVYWISLMDADNSFYDEGEDGDPFVLDYQFEKTKFQVRDAAKEEFLKLFSEYFWELWD